MSKQKSQPAIENQPTFPPVVSVLGHVDHGKTTLLDTIRKSTIAEREKGGITQSIGASSVEIDHEGKKRFITFIDTPGHEAFLKMRGRGAQVADICLLIVAATDGVKPQTIESINILKQAGVPYIVVLTKADLPTKNVDKAKQELLKEGIALEGYGGTVPVIEVSAKTNLNIKELLDLILLSFDLNKASDYQSTVSLTKPLSAIVIESKLDTRVGARATVVIKNGSIKTREDLQIDGQVFRVRTILNTNGVSIKSAGVGEAVELFGFESVPQVGAQITQKTSLALEKPPEQELQKPMQRDIAYFKKEENPGFSAILIADTQGSLEAIVQAFPKEVHLVSKKTGEVTEADILLAKSTSALILNFNTKLKPEVVRLASTEKVIYRNYDIIYELLDEVNDAVEGKLLAATEQVFGKAKILAKFPYEKTFAFGVSITDGRLARGDKIRILRGEETIGEVNLTSLRLGKNPTSKVEKGHEAGIITQPVLDIQVGDMILSHS